MTNKQDLSRKNPNLTKKKKIETLREKQNLP